MLSEQTNRPRLRKSTSFAGITKHSRSTRRLKNRRFNRQTREATSLLKDNPHFNSHPYKTQKENLSVFQRELTKKSHLKNRRCCSRQFDTSDIRILDADMSMNDKLISVLCIADKLKYSLSIEDNTVAKDDIKTCSHSLTDWPLKRHNNENLKNRKSESQTESQLQVDISNTQTHSLHITNAELDEDGIIPTPCLGEEISCPVGDPTEKTTVLPENEMIRQAESQSYEEQNDHRLPDVGIDINSGLLDQLRELEATPMFDLEDFDQDFSISIIIGPKSPLFTTPSDRNEVDRDLDDLSSLRHTDIDPGVRDSLCIESPTKQPDANRRLTRGDYRQALSLQDQCTCLLCGSNLEIILFDNFTTSPNNVHDFCYGIEDTHTCIASPYHSDSIDLTMFCPLCCESRLVQNYSSLHKC